jgi:hypothetical protein
MVFGYAKMRGNPFQSTFISGSVLPGSLEQFASSKNLCPNGPPKIVWFVQSFSVPRSIVAKLDLPIVSGVAYRSKSGA